MAEPFSNLEVAANEHNEQSPEVLNHETFAPERDFSRDSPELDKKWPPQSPPPDDGSVTPSNPEFGKKDSNTLPETGSPPVPHNTLDAFPQADEGKETVPAGGLPKEKERSRRRRPVFWIAIGLIAFLVVAIAVGVGVGVGVTRNKSINQPSSPAPAGSSSAPSLPHGLYNDTSVAIVALGDGDKRLLFQENTGDIREALYTASSKTWTANVNNVVATNARNSTPLAALLVNGTGTPFADQTGAVIFLFYIAENNVLASKQFISGSWTSRDNFSPNGSANATFATAPDSRALAVTADANSTVSGESFVFYVAQNGSVECLSIVPDSANDGITATTGPSLPDSVQGGHVLTLAAGVSSANGQSRPQVGVLTSNGTVYYSLYFCFFTNGSWSDPQLQTLLVPPLPADEQITYPTSLTLANAYPASSTAPLPTPTGTILPSAQSASYNESLLGEINIAQVFVNNQKSNSYTLFGFWVNGTDLAAYTTKNIGLSSQPTSPFPYSRLAGTTVGNSSDIYLYHQINETALAEDMYNLDGGFFTTTYFDISTS